MFAIATRGYARWTALRSEQGWTAGGPWLVERVGARLINLRISEVVWLELSEIKLAGAPPAEFTFRFLTADEIETFVGPAHELDGEHVQRAAVGHDLCFAALHDGRLAAYGWYALGSIEAAHCDGVALSFAADTAYMYKGFTHPDFRGQRLHGLAMRLALETLAAERGVTRLISTVGWLNVASLKSCDRLGYRRLGRMIQCGWGPLSSGRYPRAAQALGVKFGRQADLSDRQQHAL